MSSDSAGVRRGVLVLIDICLSMQPVTAAGDDRHNDGYIRVDGVMVLQLSPLGDYTTYNYTRVVDTNYFRELAESIKCAD